MRDEINKIAAEILGIPTLQKPDLKHHRLCAWDIDIALTAAYMAGYGTESAGEDRERAIYWEAIANTALAESAYYQQQLVDAHALLGRVVHQTSERWDRVNLTKYYPTDNPDARRSMNNPQGQPK